MARHWPPISAPSAHHFDRVIEAVRNGQTVDQALAGTDVKPKTFRAFVYRHKHLQAQLTAALQFRGHNTLRRTPYTPAKIDAALRAIETSGIGDLNRWKVEGLPDIGVLRHRAKRDPAFRVRLEAVLARRYKDDYQTGDQMRRLLRECSLYRNATRLLRLADSQDADDIRMDAIVAMLESREVSQRDLTRRHHLKVSSSGMISTDERVFADKAATVGDYIRNPDNMVWGL